MLLLVNFRGLFTFKIPCMFLDLSHKKLPIYLASLTFVRECYKVLDTVNSSERFGIEKQIKRAAVSVHLNIAEGASKRSKIDRRRYYEMARGSLVEVDSGFDILVTLNLIQNTELHTLNNAVDTCFQQLSNLINYLSSEIKS